MSASGIWEDPNIRAALRWLGSCSGDPSDFASRLDSAQDAYRLLTADRDRLGLDASLENVGTDVVAAYFAQAKSYLDDRRSFDVPLSSWVVPWVAQLGRRVPLLAGIPGAAERAMRMLRTPTRRPDGVMLELVMAANYAAQDFEVAFVEEDKGTARTPDFRVSIAGISKALYVECKRLERGQYGSDERARHAVLFGQAAELIDQRGLSVFMDVTYTRELADVPDGYLANHLAQAANGQILVPRGVRSWHDEFGFGEIRPADLEAVRSDLRKSGSLLFGSKMARLLSGSAVRETAFNLAATADPDERDPRFIESIENGSVITWQCVAKESIEKKARYVKSKLAEADEQLERFGAGFVHMAMDVELGCASSDLRRERNKKAISEFHSKSWFAGIYLHYLVPRMSEARSWLIDETVDRFASASLDAPSQSIFTFSEEVENDLPAWKQDVPLA